MFKKIKMLFCEHVFTKEKIVESVKDNLDNLVVETKYYKCEKCGKTFSVKGKIKRERNFYKGLN